MYMVTCLLHAQHAFQQQTFQYSCKDWTESVETDLEEHNTSCDDDDDDDDCFKVALASRHSGYPQSASWDNL